jgi:peptide/nickel transport system ATP-binding protein
MLSVRDLSVIYRSRSGPVPAVRGVSFDIGTSQSLGIAGESGCGKSTLGSGLLRLLPKSAIVTGEVLLNGEDVYAMKFGRLRAVRWTEMAIVFQGALHALNPVRTIHWQIAEAITLHDRDLGTKATTARVGELLEQVGLPARRMGDYPHQLSGGQRQRVMIAMALACRPHLLIADEPTTALDVMVQAQVLELLRALRAQHDLSMIFITHDLSLLTYVCERIAVMYAGRVVEEGPAADVFRTPVHPYTAALAAAFPTIGDRASRMMPTGLRGDPPDPTDLPAGCPFAPRCDRVVDSCHATDVELMVAAPSRTAACVHVGTPTEVSLS